MASRSRTASFSGGRAALATGEAEIAVAGGRAFDITIQNWSGHFRPMQGSLQYAREAFQKLGMVRVRKWDMTWGPPSMEAVKALHDGPSFHVSRKEYPADARFEGAGRASFWYVLGGSCRLNLGQEYELVEGSVVELPTGEYGVAVGSAGLVIVQVVDLRPFMN